MSFWHGTSFTDTSFADNLPRAQVAESVRLPLLARFVKAGWLLQRGMAQLPDLHVSDSSEAMLSGRKPPFRLLVRAVASDGRKVNIRHAVSEGFVVSLPAGLAHKQV